MQWAPTGEAEGTVLLFKRCSCRMHGSVCTACMHATILQRLVDHACVQVELEEAVKAVSQESVIK